MEYRGVKLKKRVKNTKNTGFFVLRPPEYFSVSLLANAGEASTRVVKVGDSLKEGSLIAKPTGKYGSYIYSPCSGTVMGVAKKMNPSGNECEHVIIMRDLGEEKEYFDPVPEDNWNQEAMLKRIYRSGMIDNFAPYEPAYKKYLLKCPIKKLIINCTETMPYQTCNSMLLETYPTEIIEGAKLLAIAADTLDIEFLFTIKQGKLAKLIKAKLSAMGLKKRVKIKYLPHIYPLDNSRLIGYYRTGKMVRDGHRTAETGVIVDSVSNCYDFYHAVVDGQPSIQKAVSVMGENCVRKANYFVKNGTSAGHVLEVVGTKVNDYDNMLIYNGVMSGIAQESLEISVGLDLSCLLFCNKQEFVTEGETACINCGKCVAACPVRIHVKNLDDAILSKDFYKASRLGCETCIGCGICSFVCPAKRNLTQRIKFAKDYVSGKRRKKPSDSEYLLLEGELPIERSKFDKILQPGESFYSEPVTDNASNVDEMIQMLDNQSKKGQEDVDYEG